MKFTPLSEQEAESQSSGLWPDGQYDFEVREATEKESSTGNEMTELEVWIYNPSGDRRLVFDYLVVTEKSAWKIRSFAASCGLLPQYERGTLIANEMVGRTGRCILMTRPANDGYPAKNTIKSYVKAAAGAVRASSGSRAKVPVSDIDDEVPF
jgi:hypothetical protein